MRRVITTLSGPPFVKVCPPKPEFHRREIKPPCPHERWTTLHDKMGDERKISGRRCERCGLQVWQ